MAGSGAENHPHSDQINDSPAQARLEEVEHASAQPSEPLPPAAVDQWQAAFDHTSQAWYYYNLATGERSWEPPDGWIPSGSALEGPCAPAQPSEAAPAPESTHDGSPATSGYFYKDAHGLTQGPYSKEQLTAWRGMLPMDLPVWYQASGKAADEGCTACQEGGVDTAAHPCADGAAAPSDTDGAKRRMIPLASVTGDADLLARWREAHPEAAHATCAAPNAARYEEECSWAARDPLDQPPEDLKASLAAAALAGLPPDDDAVKLARAAALVGKSLEEVVQWNHNAGNYTATAMHSASRGRVVSADAPKESLYQDMGSWIDPASVEEQLQRAKERGKRRLAPEEVRAMKLHKQAQKEKKMRAWLMD